MTADLIEHGALHRKNSPVGIVGRMGARQHVERLLEIAIVGPVDRRRQWPRPGSLPYRLLAGTGHRCPASPRPWNDPERRPNGNGAAKHKDDDWHPIVPPPYARPSASLLQCDMLHEYYDANDKLLFFVRRFEVKGNADKYFLPLTYGSAANGVRGWHKKAPDKPRPPTASTPSIAPSLIQRRLSFAKVRNRPTRPHASYPMTLSA